MARRVSQHDEVTPVPSRNPMADCFEARGATFASLKELIKNKASK
jgi:hypothetical protein